MRLTEFMSTPLTPDKKLDLFDYHLSPRNDPIYKNIKVKSAVVSTAKIGKETESIDVDDNVTFKLPVKFIKSNNGRKVLNTLIDKSNTQEEISALDAVKLILLPDMDIKMPIKELMSKIIVLIGKLNFPTVELKEKTINCEYMFLGRFFSGKEFDEMINMLKSEVNDPIFAHIIEKFGPGLEVYYLGGKQDGYAEGRAEVQTEIAINLIKDGFSEEIVAFNTKLPLSKIKQLKREL